MKGRPLLKSFQDHFLPPWIRPSIQAAPFRVGLNSPSTIQTRRRPYRASGGLIDIPDERGMQGLGGAILEQPWAPRSEPPNFLGPKACQLWIVLWRRGGTGIAGRAAIVRGLLFLLHHLLGFMGGHLIWGLRAWGRAIATWGCVTRSTTSTTRRLGKGWDDKGQGDQYQKNSLHFDLHPRQGRERKPEKPAHGWATKQIPIQRTKY